MGPGQPGHLTKSKSYEQMLQTECKELKLRSPFYREQVQLRGVR